MEQRCVEGDNIGPLHVSCSFYNYNYCSGAECGAFTDCNVKFEVLGYIFEKKKMIFIFELISELYE